MPVVGFAASSLITQLRDNPPISGTLRRVARNSAVFWRLIVAAMTTDISTAKRMTGNADGIPMGADADSEDRAWDCWYLCYL